ncbi:flagellar biosynthesis protein FlhB [Terriglobus sp. 2YAB30_2]|uniref:EscU/YscU/HrcU family type III secretion system export apparatus switch protein n=2 Tax=unclassified Terriglobus TaxID=2628988 RepID=UPI003F9C2D25
MSEQKTEQATPQRKRKAREKGDVVRSRELLSSLAMLAGLAAIGAVAPKVLQSWRGAYSDVLSMTSERWDEAMFRHAIWHVALPVLWPAVVVMSCALMGALTGGILQGGGTQIQVEALQPKWTRLNPAENVKQLFGTRSILRLAKSLIPAAVVIGIAIGTIRSLIIGMPVMSLNRLTETLASAYHLAMITALVMVMWAGVDYTMEWVQWNKRLKMSKQEVREEVKEAMGNPQIKGKIRQLQRQMRKRREKADISRASVVITNPTHYAVALEFSFETMSAPKVLAKGKNLHALEIREQARWAGVPIMENKPLARSLYKMVEVGQSIPFELYSAVAGILAYLYRTKLEQQAREKRMREAGGLAGGGM